MTGPTAIAISGGIDSLVSAYLIKQKSSDLFGIHFLTGYENKAADNADAIQRYCRQLNIPLHTVDISTAFKTTVVDYFVRAYHAGRTPNPCLVCNPEIKFGVLLEKAGQLGAKRLATGHYARRDLNTNGRYRLRKGVDLQKDQSYFLSRLTQAQLAQACFPLGTWTKTKVKAFASENGLQAPATKESQDICFIQGATYADFLIETAGIRPQPGDIVDTAGNRVGAHNGLHRYTIGQRRGINCPASQAYYVIRIDTRRNRLVVGFKDELFTDKCRVGDINWITSAPQEPLSVDVRIRYRHRAVSAVVDPIGKDRATVRFDQPQSSVTPGQGAVFYRGDEVLGGGWIEA